MRYFYTIFLFAIFTISMQAQIAKPLNPPTTNKNQGITKKPITTSFSGIPTARTSVINQFSPPTLSPLQRKIENNRIKVVARSKEGRPIMVKGNLGTSSGRSLDQQIFDYLEAIKTPLQLKNPTKEFEVIERKTDDLGQTHIKLQQSYKGLKVYGGQIWLHAEKGQINLFNGRNQPTPSLENINPNFSKEQAQNIANQDVALKTTIREITGLQKKLIGAQKTPELVIYHPIETNTPKLVWHLRFHPNVSNEWEYFIDAQSGEIIESYKTLCQLHYRGEKGDKAHGHRHVKAKMKAASTVSNGDRSLTKLSSEETVFDRMQNGPVTSISRDLNNFNQTVHAYELDNTFFLIDASRPMFSASRSSLPNDPIGAIWTINAQNTYPENDDFEVIHLVNNNNNWNDQISVSAHSNAGFAYDYFNRTFGRNSINGRGGTVVSIVNVSDEDGSGLDNAFWSGSAMFYGNGGQAFEPLAKALDVAGHEIAHGVIQNTANLRYQGESGAMNESYADVFGVLIDRDDYLLGEDVVNRNVFRSGALRNVADPHNGGTRLGDPGWQPDNVSEQYRGREDNGGVHINSGITNRAFFLVANTIGRDKAEQIYYRALTTYLVTTSQFVDLRASLLQAATDIHGGSSNEVSIIGQAFDAVGILGSTTGQGEQSGGAEEVEVPANPGQDFVLYTDDMNSKLFVANSSGEQIAILSDKGVLSRPSITDDGSIVVYVGLDQKIYATLIDWSAGTFDEPILVQDQPIWRNAAISRQGDLIAALDAERINTVDVFNLNTQELKTFELYNPTFTEGISTGEVDYADVLEFDFTGEFVMYDASNSIKGDFGGSDINYWDIGFIKVFDNQTNDYEVEVENNIFKLFSGLPENVSVGNPTFSKNSPNIIAYEYIDAFNTTEDGEQIYELRGLNGTTQDEGTIFLSLNLNVPNYSRLDDKMIFNFVSDDGVTNIAQIDLASDKINPANEDGTFFIQETGGAKLGVWFSDGSRTLTATNELEKAVENLEIAPNPFEETLTIQFNLKERKELTIELYNTLGQRQYTNHFSANNGQNSTTLATDNLPAGTYFLSLKSEEGIVTRKVIRGK